MQESGGHEHVIWQAVEDKIINPQYFNVRDVTVLASITPTGMGVLVDQLLVHPVNDVDV